METDSTVLLIPSCTFALSIGKLSIDITNFCGLEFNLGKGQNVYGFHQGVLVVSGGTCGISGH